MKTADSSLPRWGKCSRVVRCGAFFAINVIAALMPCTANSALAEGVSDPAAGETDQAAIVAELTALQQQAHRLGERIPGETGLTERIAHQRLERLWSEIARRTHRLAVDVGGVEEFEAETLAVIKSSVPVIDAELAAGVDRVHEDLDKWAPDELRTSAADLAWAYYRRGELFGHLIELLGARVDTFGLMEAFLNDAPRVETTKRALLRALEDAAFELSLALDVAANDAAALAAQLQDLPDEPDLIARRSVVHGRIEVLSDNLHDVSQLLEAVGGDVAAYREQLLLVTGQISEDLLDHRLLVSLVANTTLAARDWLGENALSVIAKVLAAALILLASWVLARVVARLVERGMQSERVNASALLRDLSRRFISNLILALGLMVALSQVGVSVGPLLAGLGVAGFVIGFALQDSLANFASGIMILFYRPFDLGDIVEAGGVFGTVNAMSLVNTTILTFDNQTLMVPNSKIWGDVIKNVTAQNERRVDMTFGIAYSDDIDQAEDILTDIVSRHELVLDEPAPVIKLHELGESSLNFVVRPWVLRDNYWEVYWDVTREVKRCFDKAGISIPFPQRDIHVISAPQRGEDPITVP